MTPNLCFVSSRICGSHNALWCVWGTKRRRTSYPAWVGPIQILEKVRRVTLRQTCVFASGEIYGSCRALLRIRATKHQRTIFLVRVGLVRVP
jgi:hypothetical protein